MYFSYFHGVTQNARFIPIYVIVDLSVSLKTIFYLNFTSIIISRFIWAGWSCLTTIPLCFGKCHAFSHKHTLNNSIDQTHAFRDTLRTWSNLQMAIICPLPVTYCLVPLLRRWHLALSLMPVPTPIRGYANVAEPLWHFCGSL